MEYIAYLHKDKNSDYGVSFPDFPGCVTGGKTLEEARKLILDRYQFFPQMQHLIERYYKNLPKKDLVLRPYRDRRTVRKNILRRLSRFITEV